MLGPLGNADHRIAVLAQGQQKHVRACVVYSYIQVPLGGPCTKISSDHKKRWFAQIRTTLSSASHRLLVQRHCVGLLRRKYSMRQVDNCQLKLLEKRKEGTVHRLELTDEEVGAILPLV